MSEEQKQAIVAFFKDAIHDDIAREVIFLERSEEGHIEVELRAPESTRMEPVYLSIPIQK